jgi:hypothetical protein
MTLKDSLVVVAGLDPAIQGNRADPTAASMDRRVKPGDDTGVGRSGWNSL